MGGVSNHGESEDGGYVKYPRTFHLPWSPGRTSDDKVAADLSAITAAGEVVVTLKMDGEATTIYPDGHSHARSLTATPHPSRTQVRSLAAQVAPDLPPTFRVCGENVYAVHSIEYHDLPSHFLVYSIWDRDVALSWDEVQEWSELLDLSTVPVIYRGPMLDEAGLTALFEPFAGEHEGYVVRPAGRFTQGEFSDCVLKWVRASHVQTGTHWMSGPLRVNGLA